MQRTDSLQHTARKREIEHRSLICRCRPGCKGEDWASNLSEDPPVRHLIATSAVVVCIAISPRALDAQGQTRPNATLPATSDAIDDATRAAVLAARDAIWRAWFAHDSAALAKLLPRSATAGGEGWESRSEIVEGSRQSAASGRKLVRIKFDDTRIHRNGAVAVVFSNYTMELEQQGRRNTVTGSASEVFVLEKGVWQNPFWYLGPR